MKRYKALERDGWQCSMPGCRKLVSFEEHHIQFRSHGGPDATWNLLSLCNACHDLVHSGLVQITGTAPDDITITLGHGPHRELWRHDIRIA